MPLLPFPEYRPDISDYEASTTRGIMNVLPRGDGYGPFPGISNLTDNLPGICRGGILAFKPDGSIVAFAATATDLYVLDNTTLTWTKVSKSGGPYASIPTADQWRFVQFNNLVIVVQANVVPQFFDVVSSTEFADLAGSPPQARYIDIVGRFAVLTGIVSYPYRIQWSGLNSVNGVDSWTPGINSSDYQDLPDGGVTRGVAGGETGVILQDTAIRRMTYVPGSPVIFQIERIAQDKGLLGPYSLIRAGERIFFYSNQGFYRIDPGAFPVQIGRERIDRTMSADLDTSNLQLFIGASDPRSSRVFWAYKSVNGQADRFDKMLCYDTVLDRFSPIEVSGQYLLQMSQSGITLEGLDSLYDTLESIPQSLDDFPAYTNPELAVFDTAGSLSFFRGPSLEATLETAEQGTDGQRLKVRGLRPVTDAQACFASVSRRETQRDSVSYSQESALNTRTGRCDLLVSTRYSRGRIRIPAGTDWSFISGIEPDFVYQGLK